MIFDKLLEKRAKYSIDKPWQWPSLVSLQSESNAGTTVTEWKSLQLSCVFACVRLISTTMAMLPLSLHQEVKDKSKIATNKKLHKVLYRMPNPELTAFTFKQTMQSHVLLFGNAYARKVYNNAGEVIELWVLAPWEMKVEMIDGRKIYTYTTPDGKEKKYTSDEIFHLPGLSFNGIQGYSPIKVMRDEVGLGLALQDFGSKYFKNGTNLGGFIEHPGTLGDKAFERVKGDMESKYNQVSNSHKTIILEEGMKYNKIGIPAEDAQFIQSRKFQLEEICRYFGVQLHMIQNLDRASFNNIEHQSIEFRTYCLSPWATIWEQEIYKNLLNSRERDKNYYAKFNMNALMRGDYKNRMEGYRVGVQMGLYSLNEVRKKEDENPIEMDGGDTHWVNAAMIPIDKQKKAPITSKQPVEPKKKGGEDDEDGNKKD